MATLEEKVQAMKGTLYRGTAFYYNNQGDPVIVVAATNATLKRIWKRLAIPVEINPAKNKKVIVVSAGEL